MREREERTGKPREVYRKETKRGSGGELRIYIVIINEVRWGKIGQIDRDELESVNSDDFRKREK